MKTGPLTAKKMMDLLEEILERMDKLEKALKIPKVKK